MLAVARLWSKVLMLQFAETTKVYEGKRIKPAIVYSVMQSDWNSFCRDIVLDSFNLAYGDLDDILDQVWKEIIFWDLYHED